MARPALMLAAALCLGLAACDGRREVAYTEKHAKWPAGAAPLEQYDRYYQYVNAEGVYSLYGVYVRRGSGLLPDMERRPHVSIVGRQGDVPQLGPHGCDVLIAVYAHYPPSAQTPTIVCSPPVGSAPPNPSGQPTSPPTLTPTAP